MRVHHMLIFSCYFFVCSLTAYEKLEFVVQPSALRTVAPDRELPTLHSLYSNRGSRNKKIDLLCVKKIPPTMLEEICATMPNGELFERFHLYADPHYLAIIRRRSGYEDFIKALHHKIHSDRDFKRALIKEEGLIDFVDREAIALEQARTLHVQEEEKKRLAQKKQQEEEVRLTHASRCLKLDRQQLHALAEKYQQQAKSNAHTELVQRYKNRLLAVEAAQQNGCFKFDYSNMIKHYTFTDSDAAVFEHRYGTHVDQRLHEELCDTRVALMNLQEYHSSVSFLYDLTPTVNRITALAKREQDVDKAFTLSDCAYDLVRIAKAGVNILGRGVIATGKGFARGVQKMLNPHHWLEMGEGMLRLGVFLADEHSRLEDLDRMLYTSLIRGAPTSFLQQGDAYQRYRQQQVQGLGNSLQLLKTMPWEKLLEHGVELGATFIFDGFALKAATLCASRTGRALVRNMAEVLNSPRAIEHVVEIAGMGKVVLEEGADAVNRAIDTIIKHPEIIKSETGIVHTIKKMNTGSLVIEQGGKFSFSEIRAAEHMRNLGNKVVLRTPKGTRAGGATSDLLVNGINYDVYTPITNNPNRIITAIADKKTQAAGIVLDLSQTSVTAEQLGDVMARLAGKGAANIKEVIILK